MKYLRKVHFLRKATVQLVFSACLLSSLFIFSEVLADDSRMKVIFVSPLQTEIRFWKQANNFAKYVAKDFNIDFEIIHCDVRNRLSYRKAYKKAFSKRPDFVIGLMLWGVSAYPLMLSAQTNVPIFFINSNVPANEKENIGQVRGKYKTYIGHMMPDEKNAGELLALELIKIARYNEVSEDIEVIGVSGHRENSVATDRIEGLKLACAKEKAVLNQVLYTNWSPEEAFTGTKRLLSRHKNTSVLWFVSDYMALRVKELNESSAGKLYTIGGFDWSPEAIIAIEAGSLDVSVGGHFTELGYALILLYDYYHGVDFVGQFPDVIITEMVAVGRDNVNDYYELLVSQDWQRVDFREFSMVLNPELKKYDFTFDVLAKRYYQASE